MSAADQQVPNLCHYYRSIDSKTHRSLPARQGGAHARRAFGTVRVGPLRLSRSALGRCSISCCNHLQLTGAHFPAYSKGGRQRIRTGHRSWDPTTYPEKNRRAQAMPAPSIPTAVNGIRKWLPVRVKATLAQGARSAGRETITSEPRTQNLRPSWTTRSARIIFSNLPS